ncbi:PKD domain-containing protein [Flavihumibacter petaseus]|uniref:PKD domain-containing protein n=1 Tax=Flavihumibacter petaseus NBRC 106054 TaxID=1220578 RepID=A0A0E9MUH0_9BACT|nr:PKD domain-containing protein [Flavihumibacter petaseus]GAO41133.1 hypothetical protein FPE01S_01_01450 [Flavihumibacter petaseus NBRC 106054]
MSLQRYITFAGIALGLCGLSACSKDDAPVAPDVFYSVALDGYTVKFTNATTGAASYQWDFGDGTTSTEESPSHEYPGKGKYVPTLYATAADGTIAEGSTVINISKASAVKLKDNSLADWDTVAHNVVVSGAGGGIMKQTKYDYNSDYIFFYFEMTSTVAAGNVFDFYLDTDNSPATGYLSWMFAGAGNDVLIEGDVFCNCWFDPMYFTGGANQSGWSWAWQGIAEFYEVGTVVQDGPTLRFEMGIKRAKLKGLVNKAIKVGVSLTKNDWSAVVGTTPDITTASFMLDMSE